MRSRLLEFRRLLPALVAGAVFVLISFLTRLVFAFRPEVAEIAWGELLRSFALGMVFDLAAAIYWITPFVL